MRLRLSSLRYRIAATIFTLEAVMMALVLWYTLTLVVGASRNQQLAHEEAALNAANQISSNALLLEDYSELLPYIQSMTHGGIVNAYVANHEGNVMAATDLAALAKPMPTLKDSATEFWRIRDIVNANEKLGTLAIKFSNARLFEAIKEARNLGISIAATGMAIIAVVGTLMGYLLTRRLEVLAKAAQRFAQGDLNTKTGLHGKDEVAEVGRAFDQMAVNIQEHIGAIEGTNQRFALAMAGSNDGIWDWDIANGQTYFSPRWREMLGFGESDPEFLNSISEWRDRIHPEDAQRVSGALEAYLRDGSALLVLEHRIRKNAGDYIWVLMRGKALRSDQGAATRMAGSLSDITARKEQESIIQHQAMHDALTNLPNRLVLHDRLDHAIRIAQRQHETLAVLMMDLDRFKEINDTLGHHVGDLVLREVAVRLQNAVRKSDTVARLGGDEFAVVLPGADLSKVVLIVNKILRSLEPTIILEQRALHIETSIGIALYPQHGEDSNSLIKTADIAMYTAKHNNSGYEIYDAAQDKHDVSRLGLTADLRQAIDADGLVLHYQPKIDLQSEKIVGVEALVRWRHPTLGLLSPDAFIPMAERCGLINPMTLQILKLAIHQHLRWKEAGLTIPIAINLSTRTLQDTDFPAQVNEIVQSLGVNPDCLEFEITESAVMSDTSRALKMLTRLNQMGVRLSVDDFGTGYSSLSYLQRLPVHTVKIDKSFVTRMITEPNNTAIVHSIIDLGHHLGLKVIAEGVEDSATRDKLKALGCDMAQGYYFSRPLPAEQATWLAAAPTIVPALPAKAKKVRV